MRDSTVVPSFSTTGTVSARLKAMMNTVKTLQQTNAAVSGRVVEHETTVEVIVTIPRADACAPAEGAV